MSEKLKKHWIKRLQDIRKEHAKYPDAINDCRIALCYERLKALKAEKPK